jgi:TonB family protein
VVALAVWTAGLLHWSQPIASAPIFVDLVTAAALAPAPAVAPAPVREKPVVIPARPRPKPKPEPVAKPKPVPKPVPKPEKPEEPAPPTAAQLLAKIREKVASTPSAARPATGATGSTGARGRFDPILAAYRRQVMVLLRSNWVGARAFASQPGLEVHYEVRVDGGGGVRSVSMLQASGNRYYDESAERAILKSAPFPSPPRGPLTLQLRFSPQDVL